MGLLDGQKAVTAQESAATQTGGSRSVSLDAKDEAVYTGQTKPGMDDEESTGVTDSYYDGMMHAYGNYGTALGVGNGYGQTDAPEAITPYPWSQNGNANTESEKQTEKDAAIEELDAQMEEEIAAASGLKLDAYERGYTFFDEYINLKGMRQSMEGQILSSLGIDASNFTEAELKEAFAQSTWVLDGAYDVNVDNLIADIETKYDGLKEDALGKIDNKFFVITQIGELDENPEFSFVDWYNADYDMNVQMQNMEDTSIALNGNMEDMDLTQLTIRAEYEFQNMFKGLEQGLINDSVNWFDDAINDWIAGDDSAISNIVLKVYGGEKYLEDIEDFNELRSKYVQYNWETGQYNEQLASEYEQAFKYICAEIEPYFKKAANYEETENGYRFEMTSELAGYVREYVEAKEQAKKEEGLIVGIGGTVGSTAAGAIIGTFIAGPVGTVIGAIAGGTISSAAFVGGYLIEKTQEEWDDIAESMAAFGITDKTLIIEYDTQKNDVVDISEKEK